MLYFRQILIMLVMLYTVRVVLNILGAEDYGIYNVVAGLVSMFSFLSGAMATASQRFFSYEIGRNDQVRLKQIFSLTVTVYALLAIIVVIVSETAGLWFVETQLTIPPERMAAARIVFQFSLLAFVVTILTTPYLAAIIAHEEMNIYAYVSIFEVVILLVLVSLLKFCVIDSLILYSIITFSVKLLVSLLYIIVCTHKFRECRYSFYWDTKRFRELFSYVGWNLFGSAAGVVRSHGVNVVLNIFFGPVVNAAAAIANQVNAAVKSFAQNFTTAVRPQIIKNYAADDITSMIRLVYASSKATFFLLFIFVLPLTLEMPFILGLWLKNPPEYAVLFTRLILIDALIDSVSYPLMTAAQATGKIKLYQSVVGGILLLNIPISIIFLLLNFSPTSVFVITLLLTFSAFIARMFILKLLIPFSIKDFIFTVWIPMGLCFLLSSILPISIYMTVPYPFVRLLINLGLVSLTSLLLVYFIALSAEERDLVLTKLKKVKK